MDLNKAMIIGNVVRDPEIRTTPSGQSVASFSVATNLVWTDANGQKQQKAEFHNVVAWRKLAEIIGQYVKKGSKIYIEGRIETRSWDDQNAVKRYRAEIIANNMILLDRKGDGGGSTNDNFSQSAPTSNNQSSGPSKNNDDQEISVEDIPF